MSDNLVKTLREKTEEADLDTILKTTLGGYSRKSVREYISILRRQQHDLQKSFAEEKQAYQAERERLSTQLAEADARAEAAEDALTRANPLLERAAGLEKDMDEAIARIQSDAARLEQLYQELEQRKGEVLQIQTERDGLSIQLEQKEAQIQTMKQELEQRAAQSEPEQDVGVAHVMEQPEAMQVQLALLTRERETAEKRIESIIRQEKSLFQALSECRAELESRRDQNLCMEAENKALSLRLSEQMWQNISLNREITHMCTMNDNLKRKLEAARAEAAKHNTPNGSHDTGDVFLWDFEA